MTRDFSAGSRQNPYWITGKSFYWVSKQGLKGALLNANIPSTKPECWTIQFKEIARIAINYANLMPKLIIHA